MSFTISKTAPKKSTDRSKAELKEVIEARRRARTVAERALAEEREREEEIGRMLRADRLEIQGRCG